MKYLIPYHLTRCFWHEVVLAATSREEQLLIWAVLIVLALIDTLTLPVLPLTTWAHWQDWKRCKGHGCSLSSMLGGY